MNEKKVLNAQQLFQYRRLLDKSVPQKGGSKEYAPDGSWLQEKRLELYYQERTAVLGEQRVEKLGSLVQATWNRDKELVEFSQEMGKFWSHMGFVDQNRKWLYPEEALFLMETCVLEIYNGGVPLSIQEAYSCLLGASISVEEYQTYTHLRRLGYVVLRHLGKPSITTYERKIKLDQHIKESKRRRQKEDGISEDSDGEAVKKKKVSEDSTPLPEDMETDTTNQVGSNEGTDFVEKPENEKSEPVLVAPSSWNMESVCDKERKKLQHSPWNFASIELPDIGNKDTLALKIPDSKYLPPNIVINEETDDVCMFNVREYRQQQADIVPKHRRKEADNYVFDLEFSYSDWARKHRKISARNWTEYKEKLRQSQLPGQVRPSPVSHLWEGEVTPLVRPQDATTTSEVLSRLQVIQSVDLPQCQRKTEDIKISFDVHLPNAKFKKTQPGRPNHRVCVVRSCDPPPTMADITNVVTRYHDNVSVNWAVVDSGDVAFYNMSSISLPVDVYMG